MIYKFRVVLDINEDDVFRDIEIKNSDSFEDFHNAIVHACELDGQQMASFYLSNNDWEQRDEITLFDMSDEFESNENTKIMADWAIHELVTKKSDKLLYVYDFLSMWTFFVELLEISEIEHSVDYPRMVASVGLFPENAPDKEFKSVGNIDLDDDFQSDIYDQSSYDEFNDTWE